MSLMERAPGYQESAPKRYDMPSIAVEKIEAPPLDERLPEEFRSEAREYFTQEKALLEKYFKEGVPNPREAARAELYLERVQRAEYKELGQLSEILYWAPVAAELQGIRDLGRDKLRDLKKQPASSSKQRDEVFDMLQETRDGLLQFNHLLRDFLFESGGQLKSAEVEDWLTRANGNKAHTARTLVAGVGAEVAVARLIQRTPHRVELSSLEQDARGTDLIIHTMQGQTLEVDVKTGGAQSGGISRGNREVDIESHMHQDFDILPQYTLEVYQQLGV